MKGLIHIYCGDGKGKTSAALGLALRAAGTGMPVVLVRFIKTDASGELEALSHIPRVELIPLEKNFKFVFRMTPEEKEEAARLSARMMEKAFDAAYEAARSGSALLVMDEACAAYRYGFFDRERFMERLTGRPEGLEVALTGRDPAPELLEIADYISEIRKIRHPYDSGTGARKGIEY